MVTIYIDGCGKLRAKGGTKEQRAMILAKLRAMADEVAQKVVADMAKPKKRQKRKR